MAASRRSPILFSYVVQHDLGVAPNPSGDFCTLAKCKWGSMKRNIVELAGEGDWIAGTGGANLKKSAGHGKLIYAMRVDKKIPLVDYCQMYENRIDAKHHDDDVEDGRYSLISSHFFYFGRNAIDISEIPTRHLPHHFEKKGPGYRRDFNEEFIESFADWLKATFKVGVHGPPCKPYSELRMSEWPSKVRRKPCSQQ